MSRAGYRHARSAIAGLFFLSIICPHTHADEFDDFIRLQKQVGTLRVEGKSRQALPLAIQLVSQAERMFGNQPAVVAGCYDDLARVYHDEGRFVDAEQACRSELKILEALRGPESEEVANCLGYLGHLLSHQDRFAEATALCKRALAILERNFRPDDPKLLGGLDNLSTLSRESGHLREAEELINRALAIREKQHGPNHPEVAWNLNQVSRVLHDQGRFVEAGQLSKRALLIFEKASGPESREVASSLAFLGDLNRHQGRYAQAELLCKQSLAILERIHAPNDTNLVDPSIQLGNVYISAGRYSDAEPLHQRALSINLAHLGENHTAVANDQANLARVFYELGRYNEAESLYQRALTTFQKVAGVKFSSTAECMYGLAGVYRKQKRYAESESLYNDSLAINERALGPNHPALAESLQGLAELYWQQERFSMAEERVDRAIEVRERAAVAPGELYASYLLRARLGWRQGRRSEALTDLRQAMLLAEQQRAQLAGGEHERAQGFANFGAVFEQMVAWQLELQDSGESLIAIEKSHARSLLDELSASGADLDAGRSALDREQLQQRETQLKQQVIALEHELKTARADIRPTIETNLAEARRLLYEHVRDARASSPVYRNLLSTGAGPLRISQLQRQQAGDQGLVLVYLLGDEGGYVLAIGPQQTKLTSLTLDDAAAATLGVDAGPLTADRLHKIVLSEKTGLASQLADARLAQLATPKLAALWRVLIPQSQRDELTAGAIKRLVIIPDGPLAIVPFEALVVEHGEPTRYLLDVGPPILYAPSATVLYNLAQRRDPNDAPPAREPVLTVGDPDYATRQTFVASTSMLDQLAPRSQYKSRGGDLAPLPFSGQEAAWVRDVFQEQGLRTLLLQQSQATEAQVRSALPGRQIIHLACHGLVDQRYGNFFGALALTPGSDPRNPNDDGFLTLAEIYGLKLKSCELAILSACETNFGPQQRGEGTWALSRGFLVAGCRRVVASNWLVDDEAAASLVSYYCAGLAQAHKQGGPGDYAQSLQAAKRWVRNQEKWKSPYFWGTFVLVGPN